MKETCKYVVASQQQDPVLRQQGTTMTQMEELILGVLVNVMRAFLTYAVASRQQDPAANGPKLLHHVGADMVLGFR